MTGVNQNGIVKQANEPDALRGLNRRLSYVENSDGSSPWITVGDPDDPIAPPFENGWGVPDGGEPLQFKRFLNWAHFRGSFAGGDDGTVIFTLPSLYWPEIDESMILPLSDASGSGYVTVSASTGEVTYVGSCACDGGGGGGGVPSVNDITDAVTIEGGDGIEVDTSGDTITVTNTASLTVAGGDTSVSDVLAIDFTGATVTDLGSGIVQVAISAAADFSVTDSVTTVDPITSILFIGATVADDGGGVAQVTIAGGGGGLPTGWTQDSANPANVDTNGAEDGSTGTLLVGDDAGQHIYLAGSGLFVTNGDGSIALEVVPGATTADAVFGVFGESGPQQDATDGDSLVAALVAYGLLDGGSSWTGGSLPDWFQFGSGSPVGVVAPAQVNAIYNDIDSGTYGGLYRASSNSDADWVQVSGEQTDVVPGFALNNPGAAIVLAPSGGIVVLSDVDNFPASGEGIYWNPQGGNHQAQVIAGVDGEFEAILLEGNTGTSFFPGIVSEGGIATYLLGGTAESAIPTIQFDSGVPSALFIAGTIDGTPVTLPLTVVQWVNDAFFLAGALGGPYPFTVAPGTYATLADLVTAVNAATNPDISTFDASGASASDDGSGGILITATNPFVEGWTLLIGPGIVVADGPCTAPLTVTTGVNDSFMAGGSTLVLAAGTYATADDVAAAVNASLLDGGPATFIDGIGTALNNAGTLTFVSIDENTLTLNPGTSDVLADLGFTAGQEFGDDGNDDVLADLGFTNGQTFTGGSDPVRDYFLTIPVTLQPDLTNAGDVIVELSFDSGSTYVQVAEESSPATAVSGDVRTIGLNIPTSVSLVRVTATHATIGVATYW